MDIIESGRYGIKPKTMHKYYDDFESAYLDLEDFTDIAVNTATNINGYLGVASVSSVISIDIDSRQALIKVYTFLEKDRDLS